MRFTRHYIAQKPQHVIDLLADNTELSKARLKDCLNKGAVWLKKANKKKEQRLRRARYMLSSGDRVSLYYDPAILEMNVAKPRCLSQGENYSIWYKPALMLSQGTRFGDHCALLRLAEKLLSSRKPLFLVHRLDRDARGLVLLAHHKGAAAKLSEMLQRHQIDKYYLAQVHGLAGTPGSSFTIADEIDGKSAETRVKVVEIDAKKALATLDIQLITGRLHQIRRHLSGRGYPLVGDRKYGFAKATEPLQLTAYRLSFRCPFTGKAVDYRV